MGKITLVDKIASEMLGNLVVYEVPEGRTMTEVGRDRNNDIVIPHVGYRKSLIPNKKEVLDAYGDTVSAFHMTIFQEKGKEPYIKDNVAKNGTYRNGDKIPREMNAIIVNGDELRLGKYRLTVRIEE